MPNSIRIKRSTSLNTVPSPGTLGQGEFVINVVDGRLYLAKNGISLYEIVLYNPATFTIDASGFPRSISMDKVAGLVAALQDSVSVSALNAAITGLQTAIDAKADKLSRSSALVLETDFYTTTSPFAQGLTFGALSSGALQTRTGEPDHPGVIALRDSTTANGGCRIMTDTTAFRLNGGEKYVSVFRLSSAQTTITHRQGFTDSASQAVPVDGVYLEFIGNGTSITVDGRTRSNNNQSITPTSSPLVVGVWYTAIIQIDASSAAVTFSIFNSDSSVIWTDTITTNIPIAAGRELGAGIVVTESTNDAAKDILLLDYMRIEINRTLIR